MEQKPMVQELMERGAHYGFTKTRRHPSTKSFIISTKNQGDLIDLEATVAQIEKATEVIKGLGAGGKTVLFVGTKPEAEDAVNRAADLADGLCVSLRWVGGIITNFSEIKKRITKLINMKEEKASGDVAKYTKKERLLMDKEMADMERNFGGLVAMKKLPDIIVVVDPKKEHIAVSEANQMRIPVIAIANTDCNIEKVDYPIIANDVSKTTIDFILNTLAEAYKAGKQNKS